jgi:hypothetical protein
MIISNVSLDVLSPLSFVVIRCHQQKPHIHRISSPDLSHLIFATRFTRSKTVIMAEASRRSLIWISRIMRSMVRVQSYGEDKAFLSSATSTKCVTTIGKNEEFHVKK